MDRRVARTRRNIYKAFFQLVQIKPIDEITVSELSRNADIDRKTFYLHFQTVQDVFRAFKQSIYEQVIWILEEAEQRGAEGQGEASSFDFVYFYDALNRIMVENLAFFEKLSKDTSFMFLKNDFKDVLKKALMDHYQNCYSEYQRSLYAEFVAAGAISLWTDWLQYKQVPLDTFRDTAIGIIRDAWKFVQQEKI